ncbi:hypothetical protein B0H14DRAFT_3485177 [Mycena olivaceomarginata]|nr:hypothetical protein B0H14DRAFT_3485177 [Mycena olivaceomarginata]
MPRTLGTAAAKSLFPPLSLHGFQQDLVDSCGHSFGGVQLDHFDSTNVHPDNNIATEYIPGTMQNPLVLGFTQDDVAVPFMLEHKLSGEDLALIWDLADMNSDGKLTRDEFAIELYLDQKNSDGNAS